MKKIFIILSLLVIGLPVMCDDVAEEITVPKSEVIPAQSIMKPVVPVREELPPRWSEFCEAGYENAVYKDSHDVFNIFSFVKSERVKKNYWAERRVSFEKYLKTCEVLSSDAKSACYANLRKIESQKNELYKIKSKQLLYENNVDIHRR